MQTSIQPKLLRIIFDPKSYFLLILLLCLSYQALGGVTNFDINVPNKAPGPQITKIIVLVDTTLPPPPFPVEPVEGRPAPFSVTDSNGQVLIPEWDENNSYFGEYLPPPTHRDCDVSGSGLPAPCENDALTIERPSSITRGDPLAYRYKIIIDLASNKEAWTGPEHDANKETWTISLTDTSGSAEISAICVQSFENRMGDSTPVPEGELMATIDESSTRVGIQNCANERPPLDIVLVLDKSGSMADLTQGNASEPKIEALRGAVKDFVITWDSLRGETSSQNDKLGIVLFDSNATWWSALGEGLQPYNSVLSTTIQNNVHTIIPGTTTALGSGIELADQELAPETSPRRRVVLLMSDGMQNVDKMLSLVHDDINDIDFPATYNPTSPDIKTKLPNWARQSYPIYGVTVGASTVIDSQVFIDLRTATGGSYVNTETDEQLLKPFFLQALQNFMRFNTWETLRMVSTKIGSSTPYTTRVPVTSTTQKMSINVMSPEKYGWLGVSVLPPGEAQAIGKTGSGSIQMSIDVPTSANYCYQDEWQISVHTVKLSKEGNELAKNDNLPVNLTVMADDLGIKSELTVTPKAYVPGDQIVLQASVKEFGRRLSGLSADAGDKLLVQVVKPGKSIGDLLSLSQASTTSPSTADKFTAADAKLYNHLQESPESLLRIEDTIMLMDDGRSEHGDVIAGDGIYSAVYKADLPGHYNFLFGVEGQTRESARFSRQQLVTAFVRSVPDRNRSTAEASVTSDRGKKFMNIKLTPRNLGGDRMGPGWANYFWFTSSSTQPVKAVDNLDGSYSVVIPYSGERPTVALHFLGGASTIIADEVTVENLPVKFGPDTLVVSDINELGVNEGDDLWTWQLWFLLILAILLLLFILFWRRSR